ncbi:PAS domain-containing sensor histidine kinase [Natronobeatus ordinarius]|uniref:PAS domain-containing sensor histidine kinase n=1 Tax=Natronobeatus ordinarius TaxID=2963433 RepID=UPI0020CF7696|nr:PAS domain-containing sensor histidine kinase [Natronobeatus ordinarius]
MGEKLGGWSSNADADAAERRGRDLSWFRRAVESSGHAVYMTSPAGVIEYVNPAFEKLTGYPAEETLGETPRILKSGERDEPYYEALWETIRAGEVWEEEIVNSRKNGEQYTAYQTIAPVFDERGEIEGFMAVLNDVTERKNAEEGLRRREERFRTMFQRHSAPMLLIDPGTGAIRNANEAATEFYGYSVDQFTEKKIQEINRLSPEEVARERRRAEREDRNHFVFDHELADGDVRTVEVHSSPIGLEDGTLLFSIVHDITARVEYERELERHKELVENVPVGIYRNTAGEAGTFVEINPAMVEMFDADSAEELLDQPVSRLYVDSVRREAFSKAVQENGRVTEAELELETLSGETFWGSVSAIVSTVDGETYFDGVIQDITARKEYEQRLEDQRDDLEVLNQMVRHDIRNDLQLVLAYAQTLEEYVDPEGQEYLDTVLESAHNAVELTKTARDVAEVMLQTESSREGVAFWRVLERQLEGIATSFPDAEVSVDGELPRVTVLADELLESVFRNLLKNAIQHNDKERAEVAVSATMCADHVEVRIADNGPGVPEAQRAEIFGKGEKGIESEGTGIGLYLVSTLLEGWGGSVWVEDNEPEGAIFTVELPRAEHSIGNDRDRS